MDTLMSTTNLQGPKKISLSQIFMLLFLGVVLGAVVGYLAIGQPAQEKAAKAESQQQNTVNTLVKLGQEKACAARTFDEAVGVESIVRDTLRDIKVKFPEDARQKIELCAENLRHPKIEAPAPKTVHKRTGKKK